MSLKKKLLRNATFTAIASFGSAAINFLLLPFIILKMGKIDYGLFSLCNLFAVGGYINLFEIGGSTAVIKFTAQYQHQKKLHRIQDLFSSIFSTYLYLGILLTVLVGGLSLVLIGPIIKVPPLFIDLVQKGSLIVIIGYLFQFPNLIVQATTEGLQRYDFLRAQQLTLTILTTLGTILILNAGGKFIQVLWMTLFFNLIAMVASLLFLRSQGVKAHLFHIKKTDLNEVLAFSKFVFLGNISSILFNETDRYLIAGFLGSTYMAAYDLVMRIPRGLKVILGVGNSIVMPAASQAHASQEYKIDQLFMRGLRFNLLLALPVLSAVFYFADELLLLWSSSDFTQYAEHMRWMLIWSLTSVFMGFGGSILLGMGTRLKQTTKLNWTTTGLKILLSLFLIEKLQILGLVMAQTISGLIILPFTLRLFFKELGISTNLFVKEILKFFSVGLIPWALAESLPILFHSDRFNPSLKFFFFKFITWCTCYFFLIIFIVFDKKDQATLFAFFHSIKSKLSPARK